LAEYKLNTEAVANQPDIDNFEFEPEFEENESKLELLESPVDLAKTVENPVENSSKTEQKQSHKVKMSKEERDKITMKVINKELSRAEASELTGVTKEAIDTRVRTLKKNMAKKDQ